MTGRGPRNIADAKRREARRLDSRLENAQTAMGIHGKDAAEATCLRGVTYTPAVARRWYRYSWAARREVERPASDIVSQRPAIVRLPEDVSEADVWAYLAGIGYGAQPEDRGALQALGSLHLESHKEGGAAAVLVVRDGLDAWEPLDLTRVESFEAIEILEREEITPYRTSASGPPEFYIIGASRTGTVTAGQIVHASRVIVSRGARLGPRLEYLNNGWGASQLEQLHDERLAMHTANQELGSLATKVNQDVVYLAELSEMLDFTEGPAAVDERLAMIARQRGQHRLIPLDAGSSGVTNNGVQEPGRPSDKMESLERPVRGLADLGVQTSDQWASGTGQTKSIALGQTPGGLNTGENAGDWQSWGSKIQGDRMTWLAPRLDRVLEVAFAAQDGPTGGVIPESWSYDFPTLWQPSELEKAQIRQINSGVDATYAGIQALPVPVITEQRFVQGETGQISMDADTLPAPTPGEPIDPAAEPEVEPGDLPEEPEPEPTEADIAWSEAQPPADAATATDLAESLSTEQNKISAQLVHRVARDYGVTAYPKPGYPNVPLYSLQDIKAALNKRQNGEPPEELDEVADRADELPRWRWLARRRRGR